MWSKQTLNYKKFREPHQHLQFFTHSKRQENTKEHWMLLSLRKCLQSHLFVRWMITVTESLWCPKIGLILLTWYPEVPMVKLFFGIFLRESLFSKLMLICSKSEGLRSQTITNYHPILFLYQREMTPKFIYGH